MSAPSSIKLQLLTGRLVPEAAPASVVEKLQSVEVTCSVDAPSGFQLRFNADRATGLSQDFALLAGTTLRPWNRVIVAVDLGGSTVTLIDGFITHQELAHDKAFGASTLTVTGEDVSILMDRVEVPFEYPEMGDSAIASAVLEKYALIGILSVVCPTVADLVPTLVERVPQQNATDRAYLNALAQAYGYAFYVRPGPVPLTNIAYWGPPIRIGLPLPVLSMDLGPATNVDKITFSLDASATNQVFGLVQDDISELDLPLTVLSPSRFPPLATDPVFDPLSLFEQRQIFTDPRYGYLQAYVDAQAMTDVSTDNVVTVDGEIDTLRYGAILGVPGVVDVRGAGQSYDGRYVTRQVTHSIQRGSYKQSFKLSREGTGSTISEVSP